MQKWEYTTVIVDYDVPRYVNGVEIPQWKKGPPIWVYLNKLGDDGWEICGFIPSGETGLYYKLFLKRQKP